MNCIVNRNTGFFHRNCFIKVFFILILGIICNLTSFANDSLKLNQPDEWDRLASNKLLRTGSFAVGAVGLTSFAYFSLDADVRSSVMDGRWADKVDPVLSLIEPMGRGKHSHFAMGTFFIAGTLSGNYRLQKAAVIWVGSFITSDIIVNAGKRTFQRYRPEEGMPYNSFGNQPGMHNNSLPSQHTANAFVAATVISSVFNDKKWVAPVCYTAAGLVGLQRIISNSHWTSDVIAGAAIGYLSSRVTYFLYNKLEKRMISIFPSVGTRVSSLSMILIL